MATDKFFDESREQSVIKAEIVEKYFDAWAGIILSGLGRFSSDRRIGYVDLFAGPGRYKDGAISTPLRVLGKALAKPEYSQHLLTIFNDKDEKNARSLQEAIAQLPGIENLKNAPQIWNREVGENIAADFAKINKIPILAFIDPWGYKGLSLKLVDAFLKDWGCDCIFFFNYSRINAGLSNPLVKEHMGALFGPERADRLAAELETMGPAERESTIVNELAQALKAYGNRFVLPFCFKNATGKRTTHHLILVTKHFKGYEVMKGIMAKASSSEEQGVPSFIFSPAQSDRQALLFSLNQPLAKLRTMIFNKFAGRTLTMRDLYEEHSVDLPFIAKNYKEVLKEMEEQGAIQTAGRKSNRGFGDTIVVTFPRKAP